MPYSLRPATEVDFKAIHGWLLDQERRGQEPSLYTDWNLTENVYEEGRLLVFICENTGKPHAYMWDDFGVVEVWHSERVKDLGKKMVQEAMRMLAERNVAGVRIHAAPISSKGFWQKMGVEFYTDDRGFLLIPKKLELPTDGKKVEVQIKLFKEFMLYEETPLSHETISVDAIQRDGVVYLGERVGIYQDYKLWKGDAGIEILVDRSRVYFGKVKHGKNAGIEWDSKGWSHYIDKINP